MHITIGRKHLIGAAVVLAAVVWWFVSPRQINKNNTVYEYKTAPIEAQVKWASQMCRDGYCIHPSDWSCGFTVPHATDAEAWLFSETVTDCFYKALERANPWDRLDKLRKICGRELMIFKGEPFGSEAECKSKERVWGKKTIILLGREAELYPDKEKYLGR